MSSHEFQGAIQYISQLFQIRPEWLVFPEMITAFIVPYVLNIFMFYFFLEKMVRVFPGTGVNVIIAAVISFLMLPFNQITILIAPLIIGVYASSNIAVKIAIAASLYILVFFVLPWAISAMTTGFRF